ncbi:unnamed protein product [Linum tenue]|uniref:Uncharacterized protein n=2 Tax=Linum tenue TaxID=586396 RepID=A0AAV0MZ67_9ROSI|nr:unnamed protein product [Linum tenue]
MYGLQQFFIFFFSHPLQLASLLLFLFLSAKFLLLLSNKESNSNSPPSPWKLPILGNLHQLGTHPHRTLRSLSLSHGPLFLLRLGSAPTLVASSPESAKQIMKTHDLAFSNRPYSAISNRLLYNYKDLSQTPYSAYWRQMRAICVTRLLSARRVDSFRHIREQEAALLVATIEEGASHGTLLDLGELISRMTNDVVCRVAFGRKYGDDDDGEEEGGRKFKLMLEEFGAVLGTVNVADFIPWLGWVNRFNGLDRRVEKVFAEFDEFLDRVVEEKSEEEEEEEEKDIVDVLLQIQRETPDSAVDRDTIKAIVLDMFAAGSDTTYTALEWTMTEILRHPRVMEKLQQEIRVILGDERNVREEVIERMDYLKAVIKESFRLHPPIPLLVPRESTQDVKVQGYDVPEKTRVIVNAWAIGRDSKRWGDDAEEFRPERFLNSKVDFKGQDFELIPFGAGRRGCPGISFATASMEITLVSMLHRFDWSVPGGEEGGGLDADEAPGLAVHRRTPLLAVPTLYSP